MSKKVSVIIPVYRVECYIRAAVQSVLEQTYTNFEVIIVDNGSPDRSVEICQQFDDPRITIIRQENRGPSGSRNTGIRHAQGDYIAFLDGDDLWVPDKLAKHVEYLEHRPNVGVSICYSAFINEAGEQLGVYMMPKLRDITPGHVLCRCPMSNGSVSVYRREIFEAIAFEDNLRGELETCYFNERLQNVEDVEMWVRMALQPQWVIEGIPEILTLYRLNATGSSANIACQIEHLDKLVEIIRTYAPDFIAEWERPFKAYQLRFMARRMVTIGDGAMAVKLIHRALAMYPQLLKEESKRTLVTLGAAYLLRLLPKSLFMQAQDFGLKKIKKTQEQRISVSG